VTRLNGQRLLADWNASHKTGVRHPGTIANAGARIGMDKDRKADVEGTKNDRTT